MRKINPLKLERGLTINGQMGSNNDCTSSFKLLAFFFVANLVAVAYILAFSSFDLPKLLDFFIPFTISIQG